MQHTSQKPTNKICNSVCIRSLGNGSCATPEARSQRTTSISSCLKHFMLCSRLLIQLNEKEREFQEALRNSLQSKQMQINTLEVKASPATTGHLLTFHNFYWTSSPAYLLNLLILVKRYLRTRGNSHLRS